VHAIEETFSKLARTRIGHLNTKYEDRLARFLRSLQKSGEIGGPAGAHCRADTPHLDAGGIGGANTTKGAAIGKHLFGGCGSWRYLPLPR